MDLNFRGTKLSRFSRFDRHPRMFSPAKFKPVLTGQRMTSILMNSDVIILQNGYRGLGCSEHQCGVALNCLCEQTHEILLGT